MKMKNETGAAASAAASRATIAEAIIRPGAATQTQLQFRFSFLSYF